MSSAFFMLNFKYSSVGHPFGIDLKQKGAEITDYRYTHPEKDFELSFLFYRLI